MILHQLQGLGPHKDLGFRAVGAVGAGGSGLRLLLADHIGYAEYWHTLVGQNVLWRE